MTKYTEAIGLYPTESEFYGNRGLAFRQMDQFTQALKDYNESLRLNPNNAVVLVNRGALYQAMSKFDLAEADYRKAMDIEPKYTSPHLKLGALYFGKGDYDKAVTEFTKAININGTLALAYNNRGETYEKQADALLQQNKGADPGGKAANLYKQARDDYNTVLRNNAQPRTINEAHKGLARIAPHIAPQ
jgi:tetratricopeptide (TPR) repeat protein